MVSGASTPTENGTLTKVSGTGDDTIAFGSIIPEGNSTGANMGNVIENNTFKAIVETSDASAYAFAFADDALLPNTSPLIENNIFESNDVSLQIGYDYGGSVYDGNFVSNTCRRDTTDGDQTRAYQSVGVGYWISTVQGVQLIDMHYPSSKVTTTHRLGIAAEPARDSPRAWMETGTNFAASNLMCSSKSAAV
jgi:hypothetical protein